jgi:cobalamin-dependent methionine synthase I
MEIITDIPFALNSTALLAQFRIAPDSSDARDINQLLELAQQHGRPKAAYAVSYVQARNGDSIQIDDVVFSSRALCRNLQNVERVFPLLATCGNEMDEMFIASDDMLKNFFWDGIKAQLLETASNFVFDLIRKRYRLGTTSAMWPGSGDAEVWPIEQQKELFKLLGDAAARIGIALTGSYLMVPNKSVSGILFPTERDFRTCELCHRSECPSRQAPFNEVLWQDMHED